MRYSRVAIAMLVAWLALVAMLAWGLTTGEVATWSTLEIVFFGVASLAATLGVAEVQYKELKKLREAGA